MTKDLGKSKAVFPFNKKDWETLTVEEVRRLVGSGADVNARDENGWTALMRASLLNNSNKEVIQVLIDSGADVNARDKNGWTALMFASANTSNPEVIEFLIHYTIKQGIEVDWNEIWKLAKGNEDLKGTPVYWQINELRFNKNKYDEALIS